MFEWDASKAAINRDKHGVGFEEASTVFVDPERLDGPDLRHSDAETRRLCIGLAAGSRTLVVSYTVRFKADEEVIRIISARPASRKERKLYESAQD